MCGDRVEVAILSCLGVAYTRVLGKQGIAMANPIDNRMSPMNLNINPFKQLCSQKATFYTNCAQKGKGTMNLECDRLLLNPLS